MLTLHAATSNPGKLLEFTQAAQPAGITILPLPNLRAIPQPAEDAPTFAGNADLKALAYSRTAPGLLVFADDSGLEGDALHGQPGVLSARLADTLNFQPHLNLSKDERNNSCLLSLLQDFEHTTVNPSPNRAARFRCALTLARNGEVLLRAHGILEGEILNVPRGQNGFGYDPLFLLSNRDLTLAELPPKEKWAISHRGNAFRSLLKQLISFNP